MDIQMLFLTFRKIFNYMAKFENPKREIYIKNRRTAESRSKS